jgi:hypothetical protein
MKRAIIRKKKHAASYVRIDDYTWIERKSDESDEEARQRFLMKLARFFEGPALRPAH